MGSPEDKNKGWFDIFPEGDIGLIDKGWKRNQERGKIEIGRIGRGCCRDE